MDARGNGTSSATAEGVLVRTVEIQHNDAVNENINLKLEVHHLRERLKELAGGKEAMEIDAENYELKKDIRELEERQQRQQDLLVEKESTIQKLTKNLMKMDQARQDTVKALEQCQAAAQTYRNRAHYYQRKEGVKREELDKEMKDHQALIQKIMEESKRKEEALSRVSEEQTLKILALENELRAKTCCLEEVEAKGERERKEITLLQEKIDALSANSIKTCGSMDRQLQVMQEETARLTGQIKILEEERERRTKEEEERANSAEASRRRAVELAEDLGKVKAQVKVIEEQAERYRRASQIAEEELRKVSAESQRRANELLETTIERDSLVVQVKNLEGELARLSSQYQEQVTALERAMKHSKTSREEEEDERRRKLEDLLSALHEERKLRLEQQNNWETECRELRRKIASMEEENCKYLAGREEERRQWEQEGEKERDDLLQQVSALQEALDEQCRRMQTEEVQRKQLQDQIEDLKRNTKKLDQMKAKIKTLTDEKEELNANLERTRSVMKRIVDRKAKALGPGGMKNSSALEGTMRLADEDKENLTTPTMAHGRLGTRPLMSRQSQVTTPSPDQEIKPTLKRAGSHTSPDVSTSSVSKSAARTKATVKRVTVQSRFMNGVGSRLT